MNKLTLKNKGIFIVCGVYCLVSFALFLVVTGGKAVIGDDSPGYIRPAEHLVESAFFSADGITPEYLRTPGYPLFLAFFYLIGGNNTLAVAAQILLMTFKVYLFYRILIMLQTPCRLTLLGSALLLVNAQSYGYSFGIMTEALFSFFLITALYFLVKYLYHGENILSFLAFAVALNYALFVRPILMYFNMLMCVTLLILFILKKLPLKCFTVFSLCFIIVFGGWSYRNYLHSSVFVFSTIQNNNMQQYYAPIITAYIEKIDVDDVQGYIPGATDYHNDQFLQQYPEVNNSSLNAAQKSLLRKEYGLDFIKAHIPQYLAVNLRGLIKMMFRPFQTGLLFKSTSVSAKMLIIIIAQGCVFVYLCVTYILFLAGLIRNRQRTQAVHISIFLISGYLAAGGAIFATARFRDPFFPLVLLSAINNSGAIIQLVCGKLNIPLLNRIGAYLLSNEDGT